MLSKSPMYRSYKEQDTKTSNLNRTIKKRNLNVDVVKKSHVAFLQRTNTLIL
jgi:hypothetical protein